MLKEAQEVASLLAISNRYYHHVACKACFIKLSLSHSVTLVTQFFHNKNLD